MILNQNLKPLLNIENLNITLVEFKNKVIQKTKLLDHISFKVSKGECLVVVGESGSGKSLLCKILLGLYPAKFYVEGNIIYHNKNLLKLPFYHKDWMSIRGKKIAFIPQNSTNAFNPLLKISTQIEETLKHHRSAELLNRPKIMENAFFEVALPNYLQILDKHPYELSGGTLQRISIALALMLNPEIIVADEPTSNIDWISKKEIVNFLKQIVKKENKTLIMVTHDFSDANMLADNVIVLQNGQLVEKGLVNQVLHHPLHIHTKRLIEAHKKLDTHFYDILSKDF